MFMCVTRFAFIVIPDNVWVAFIFIPNEVKRQQICQLGNHRFLSSSSMTLLNNLSQEHDIE